MSDLAATIGLARRLIVSEGRECALVGGFAVSARTEPRFTRDVDLAVAVPDDEQAEVLIRRFLDGGHEVLATVEQDSMARLAMVRLRLTSGNHLDLLFASSGIEAEIVAEADAWEILPGVAIRVASVGHLIALKLLSRSVDRPTDDADLLALMASAGPSDLASAVEAVGRIEDRGYARGRDLRGALRGLADEASG